MIREIINRSWVFMKHPASWYRQTVLRAHPIVAVVGSMGKTTTAHALDLALTGKGFRHAAWNHGGGLAYILFRTHPWGLPGVFEVGLTRSGEMIEYARCFRPSIAILTGIGDEHGQNFESLEAKLDEKAQMLILRKPDGLALIQGDDERIRAIRPKIPGAVLTFGFDPSNDIQLGWKSLGMDGSRITVHYEGRETTIDCRVWAKHTAYSIGAAVVTARSLGLSDPQIVS